MSDQREDIKTRLAGLGCFAEGCPCDDESCADVRVPWCVRAPWPTAEQFSTQGRLVE